LDEAQLLLFKQIDQGKRPRGRVYQIIPPIGHGVIRSLAAALDGSFFHVFMDPAAGPYSDLRRLRLPQVAPQTCSDFIQTRP
jgi:hypothetical protein